MIAAEGFVANVVIHTLVILVFAMIVRFSVRVRGMANLVWMSVGVAVVAALVNHWFFPWMSLRNLFHQ